MTVGITEVFTLVPALYPTIELAGAAYPAWTAGQAFKPGGATAFTPRSPGHVLTAGSISAFLAPAPPGPASNTT